MHAPSPCRICFGRGMVFLKKLAVILFFLVLSYGLLRLLPAALYTPGEQAAPFVILRVWNAEEEPAVQSWLREQAKAYERATGQRVYLRTAAVQDAQGSAARGLPPDVLILRAGESLLALRGYALIVRDGAAPVTPAPTSPLFYRPSRPPEPAETPAPWPDETELRAILCPEALMHALPGTVFSSQPAVDFSQGKADAALLSPGQAAGLAMGYRAYAVPEGKGFLPVRATAYSEAGEAYLTWLQDSAAQKALGQAGLFSPRIRLYGPDDPVRYLIENSLFAENCFIK